MLELYDKVKIKGNGIVGQIIDISERKNGRVYVVESDTKGRVDGAYPSEWPLFDCRENELEKV